MSSQFWEHDTCRDCEQLEQQIGHLESQIARLTAERDEAREVARLLIKTSCPATIKAAYATYPWTAPAPAKEDDCE